METAPVTAIDFSRLPPPVVVEQINFEIVRDSIVAQLRLLMPAFDALVPSDPAMKLVDAVAYCVLLERQRQNDSCRAVLLPFATGADLDNLAALFGVTRRVLQQADPQNDVPEILEADADLRLRVILAPESYSTAGPEGAYVFHSLSADADVLDASATSPSPDDIRAIVANVLATHGAAPALVAAMNAALDAADWPTDVRVTVLSRSPTGAASEALLATVAAAITPQTVRPLSDHVIVQSAAILPFEIEAELYTYPGPDSGVILTEARRRLDLYLESVRRLGRDVTRSAIIAALHPEGVQRVVLVQPAADVVVNRQQAAHCTAITCVHVGHDE